MTTAALTAQAPAVSPPVDIFAAYGAELGPVCRFLRRMGVAEVEDVAHDAFVVAFSRRDQFDPTRPLRPWLMGIALKLAKGRTKRAATRREVSAPLADAAVVGPGLDEAIEKEQRRRLLLAALDTIDEDQRLAFVWHDLEERPVAELAAELEVPLHTVYSRLKLARQKVSQRLAEKTT